MAGGGGRRARGKETAPDFTPGGARLAGRKGGEAVSRDRAHMSAIGREGGHSRGRTRQPLPNDNANVSTSTGGSGIDTERQNYISRASDRESFGEPERRPMRQDNNELRSDNNPGRGTL